MENKNWKFRNNQIPDFHFETDLDPDPGNIELDGMDEDLWSDYYPEKIAIPILARN